MGECERRLTVNASADTVWQWLEDPRNAFSVNIFHAEVHHDGSPIDKGSVVEILHDFFGAHKELRHARVTSYRKYFVQWGEYLVPDPDNKKAKDSFPHRQSFEVVPIDDTHCEIVNRLSGKYRFPGSSRFGEPLFNKYMPYILDDDNQVIAAGCGAIDAADVKTPKGLFLWPLMASAARFTKKSTRRNVLEKAKGGASEKPDQNKAARPASTTSGDQS